MGVVCVSITILCRFGFNQTRNAGETHTRETHDKALEA